MTLDCDKYRINMSYIKSMLDDKTPEERLTLIGRLSINTYIPIIVVACYVGELYGFTEQLNEFIEDYKKFYSVTEIIGLHSDTSLDILSTRSLK